MRLSTKYLVRRKTGWYLTEVQMEWLIVQRRQGSLTFHALTEGTTLIQDHGFVMFNTNAYGNETALTERELICLIYMVWWP